LNNIHATAQQQPVEEPVHEVATERKPVSLLERWFIELEKNDSALVIRALLVVIALSVVCLIVLLIWILINRNRMQTNTIETQHLKEILEGLVFDYITAENESATQEAYRKIARTALTDSNREILINQIRELSRSMSMGMGGDPKIKTKLRYLYTSHLHLEKDSIRKLYSRKWHIQVKGFRELAFMDVTEANSKIRQALKSKNNILRMEAQLALIRLNENDPFEFLDHLTHPFTLWEQLNVYELIAIHNLPIPQFSRWTSSQNKTVVIFALRMIQVFKQKKALPQIIKCLGRDDEEIRRMAIHVCGELQLRESLVHLKQLYKNESFTNCLEIVITMGKMPDESMLNFLKLVLDKEDDVLLQIEAAQAIHKMGEIGIAALIKLMKSEYKNYQIIIRHVLDKRIH